MRLQLKSETTHSIGTITGNIQYRVQFTDRFAHPEGGRNLTKIRIYKEKKNLSNGEGTTEVDVTATQMAEQKKKKRMRSSFVKMTLQLFSKPSFLLRIVQLVPH